MKRYHKPAIFLLLALLFAGLPAARDYLSAPALVEEYGRQINTPVVMYTTQSCPYCQKARMYFRRHKIDYLEYDIDASPENLARFRDLGGTGVPLILVEGKRLQGFSPRSFKELLK